MVISRNLLVLSGVRYYAKDNDKLVLPYGYS